MTSKNINLQTFSIIIKTIVSGTQHEIDNDCSKFVRRSMETIFLLGRLRMKCCIKGIGNDWDTVAATTPE